ncbi:MAG: ImmA/IrrE family metallo-endopeptidase, partial [Acidobacteria bacterium]|nr:ImmA/IrrE family metallo-endopeptidase [Acidobacteriota bacterium]
NGIIGPDVSMREMWRVYREEGIEELHFRGGFKRLRGAYFNDEYGVTVMLARGLPDDPTIFTMAHELKHHLVDSEIGTVLCRTEEERRRIEVGAEVFAAEFIYPEKDFVYDLFRLLRGMPHHVSPEILVKLKRETGTTLSHTALAKRAVLLRLADEKAFDDVRWRDLRLRSDQK